MGILKDRRDPKMVVWGLSRTSSAARRALDGLIDQLAEGQGVVPCVHRHLGHHSDAADEPTLVRLADDNLLVNSLVQQRPNLAV